MPRYRMFASWSLLLAFAPGQVVAAESPSETYAAVRAEWNQVTGKMDELAEQFRAASAEQREEIRQQYVGLMDKANATLPKLRVAAVAAYGAAPNQDREMSELLVGIAANDMRNDQPEEALELAELLIKNDCPEKAVYGLAGVAAYHTDAFAQAEKYLKTAQEANALDQDGQMCLTDADQAKKLWAKEQQLRQAESQAGDLPRILVKTTKGDMVLELYENEAPQTVGNFVSLVEKGFYDGLTFHRVLPGFMAQGGCPTGSGDGGPGYNIYCECYEASHRSHFRGTLSMAHAGRDTGGSQFFITFRRTPHLDGRHTVFGRVVEGLDVLENLERIDPQARSSAEPDKILEAKVIRKRDHEYKATQVR